MKHPDGKVVVILNAPPGAGKDTLAYDYDWASSVGNFLLGEWQYEKQSVFSIIPSNVEFKRPLRDIASSVIATVHGYEVAEEFLSRLLDRELKEQPWDKLGGMSPRQFLIYTSENYVKVCFGGDAFGKIAARNVVDSPANSRTGDIYIFSDGGFVEEIDEVVKAVGAENVYVLQWEAEGCSFVNDSRRYLSSDEIIDGVRFVKLACNPKDGDIGGWKAACLNAIEEQLCKN